jgi:phage terminase large subunit-like protein
MSDFVQIARQYADDIIGGRIPAARTVILAAERARRDHARPEAPDWPYTFNEAAANKVCTFISGLKHVRDAVSTKAAEKIELLPWQVFALTEIFGWMWRDNGKRRYRRAYIELGKGNGKSTLGSAIALYMMGADGEGGAEVLCAASLRDQARIVLDGARRMAQRDKELCKQLGIKVLANAIVQLRTQSILKSLPAKATSVEGVSLHCGILDEVHAQHGRALYDTLSTACTKRQQSLFLMVTTAGNDSAGVAFEIHQFLERLLAGEAEDNSFFALLFGIDVGDSWDDPVAWEKANPSWGVSVDPRAIAEEAKRAAQIPGEKRAFRVFHLSEWLLNGGDEPFLDSGCVRACYDRNLNEAEFAGQQCVIGLDLASRLDLCSCVRVHSRTINGKTHHFAFCRNWLPEATVREARTAAYTGWVETGQLVATPGAVTDLDVVEEFVFNEAQKYNVRDISFDPLQSNQIITHLQKLLNRTDLFTEVGQFAKYLTPGMHELQESIGNGRLHTNSPILLWCLGNLQSRTLGMHMLMPARPKDRTLKIDAAVALVMALRSVNCVPLAESAKASPYLTRGILFI